MTVHVFIHLNAKRAETISPLDLGATKKFSQSQLHKMVKPSNQKATLCKKTI